jgi:thioredoxin reductase (NADPH)
VADLIDETPDLHGAYPRLNEAQIKSLEPYGHRRRTRTGEVLFREGDTNYDFIVILSGRVAVVEHDAHGVRLIAVHGERRFLGELSLLAGQAALFTAVVREDGEILSVPATRLREVATEDPSLGELVLRAFLLRRSLLIGLGTGLRIIGSRYSPDTRRVREFAARNRLPHVWYDLEEDQQAEEMLRALGVSPDQTPVVILRGTQVLRNPSNAEVAELIGLRRPDLPQIEYDLIVVGAGPGGLAAAVYAASEGLATVALDAVATGGQAATSSRIENYLGFPAGISGADLAERGTLQAEKFGARISVPVEATALEHQDSHHVVRLDDGSSVAAHTVVIASGVQYRRLPVPNLEQYEPHSVYYAATYMEARICAGDPVAVVGGGNSAGQATLMLSRYAAHLYLIVREHDLTEHMSRYLADRIKQLPGVTVMTHTEVRELLGENTLTGLVVEDTDTGERGTVEAKALFVFIGGEPHTRWLSDSIALDSGGYVLTGAKAARPGRDPMLLETSCPGVFAVGDVRSGSVQRVASAVGEGAMAVRLVHEHFAAAHRVDAPAQVSVGARA